MERQDYEIDWPNLPVKYLIVSKQGEYIVFLDNENDIDWKTSDEFDNNLHSEQNKEINKIKNEINRLESILLNHLEDRTIINFKRQLGEALVRAFDNDYENATKMLGHAENFIVKRNIEESRFMFMTSCGLTSLIALLILGISWLLKEIIIEIVGISTFYIAIAVLMGAVGALLSVILRIGKTVPDYNATKKLHYLEGVNKIIAGMISALIVALCIKSEILLPIFTKIETTNIAMILGGLIAGASERFAPSIINKLDNVNK
jgi:hypothetical protein